MCSKERDKDKQIKILNKALLGAIFKNNKTYTKTLLKCGANPNIRNQFGETALILAVYYLHKDIVRLLLENRADVELQDKYGDTALIYALKRVDSLEIVKLLLKCGANPNILDREGDTPLKKANEQGNKTVVKLLSKYGACRKIVITKNE